MNAAKQDSSTGEGGGKEKTAGEPATGKRVAQKKAERPAELSDTNLYFSSYADYGQRAARCNFIKEVDAILGFTQFFLGHYIVV